MTEEIEKNRYYLEPFEGQLTSICLVKFDSSADGMESVSDFSVIIGLIEGAATAARKSLDIEELLKPAHGIRHGAPLKDGRAVITLSYACDSPFGTDLPVPTLPSPAYVLGVLASAGYLSMDDYEKAMTHYLEMENIPHGLPAEKTSLHANGAVH